MNQKEIVKKLTSHGCLVEPDAADCLNERHLDAIEEMNPKPMVVNSAFLKRVEENPPSERSDLSSIDTDVKVLKHYEGNQREIDVEDFVSYYNDRFVKMKDLLTNRMELSNSVSIDRMDSVSGDGLSIIGMVIDKYKTSSGKWIVNIEDDTGDTKLLVEEDEGERIVGDEVIGVSGTLGDDIIFADEIVRPDVPLTRDITTTEEEVYAVFTSDFHFGSIDTLCDKADKLIEWLKSDEEVASKVGYLFINGDIVEGVGNYPGQEDELEVMDIYKQYERFEEFVKKIPSDVQVIVTPGNHDFVRMAEPQPPLPEELFDDIYDYENVYFVSNPSLIEIHGFDSEGLEVLMYHGYSFDNHVDAIPDLRDKAYDDPTVAMVDMLKRRHLAPTFGSNLLSPEDEDLLVIEEVPDVFVIGHTHGFSVDNYKGINLISSGTMQSQTSFQKRMGHKPDPGIVGVVNLETRDTFVKEL
ncbi:MAG: DNA-directed DNA polymerase II small subunit [Candidatus Nanohaloarchaeota archaeon QJJ-9]|nr:DNA-directed DNA polymerase II small subunit [Candidatus Nanohaloarchaeota archaeon QJJ-9]